MELVFFAIIGVILYVTDKFVDYMADQAAGVVFEQLHEVIGNVSYFGKSSHPILKHHFSETVIPFCPALTHTFKVLSRTECGHWFWFNSKVHLFRVESFSVKPVEESEVRETLIDKHELDIYKEYFPEENPSADNKKTEMENGTPKEKSKA